MRLVSSIKPATDQDKAIDVLNYTPSFTEALPARISEQFRFTTTRALMEEGEVKRAEQEEYGYSPTETEGVQGYLGMNLADTMRKIKSEKDPAIRLDKEAYKHSEFFREGVQWQDGWTEARARIMAEQYDQRRYIDEILQRRRKASGIGEEIVGFGASLIGGLADPINLIPFTAGFKAASIGGKIALAAAEGAAGTALADMFVLPDLKQRGENVGFADLVADVVAGTVLGAGFGAVGHGVSKALGALAERRAPKLKTVVDDVAREMDAPHIKPKDAPADFNKLLLWDRAWTGEDPVKTVPDMTPEGFLEAKFGVRMNLSGVERVEVHNMLEKAIADLSDGKDVDLGVMFKETQLYSRLPEDVRTTLDTSNFSKPTEIEPELEPIDMAISDENLALIEQTPEEAEMMAQAVDVENKISQMEEAGLGVVECITGVTNV